MKKFILAIVLSSFLPAIAVAEDKRMRNSNPNAPLMAGKHMMNASPSASLMSKKHMMNDNPYSSHTKKDTGVAKTNRQSKKGYRIIKYKK